MYKPRDMALTVRQGQAVVQGVQGGEMTKLSGFEGLPGRFKGLWCFQMSVCWLDAVRRGKCDGCRRVESCWISRLRS